MLLASNLLNTDSDALRQAFLTAAARHLEPGGPLIAQWRPPEWFDANPAVSVRRQMTVTITETPLGKERYAVSATGWRRWR